MRPILWRLDVSPNSLMHSGVYAEMYSTRVISMRFMVVYLVNQLCSHENDRFASPFHPLGALAVPT
eukprot:7459979-Pyramimonas_sp.AAC.1